MRKKIRLLGPIRGIFLLLCCQPSFSQNDTSYYFFDEDFNLSADTAAINSGIAIKQQDSTWQLVVMNSVTKKVVMKATYLAHYLQKEHGLIEYYFPDGTIRQRGNYHEGVRTNLWRTWDENGRLIDSIFFDSGIPKMATEYNYNLNNVLTSYSHNDLENKKKINITYYEDGTINNETEFIGKGGHIKRYYPGGKLLEIRVYDNKGMRSLHQYFREDGTEIPEKTYIKEQKKRLEEMMTELKASLPEFKGGSFSFEAFVQRSLKLPDNFKNIYHNMESIRFSFTLNEKGMAEHLRLISPPDAELEKAIDNMLRVMPAWDMKGLKSFGPVTQTINLKME